MTADLIAANRVAKMLDMAILQNSHDMLLTGDEIRECAEALAAYRSQSPAEAHQLTRDDLDLCRQWFNSVQDTNGGYLDRADYVLAERIYRALGQRVPSSVTDPLGLPASDVQPKGTERGHCRRQDAPCECAPEAKEGGVSWRPATQSPAPEAGPDDLNEAFEAWVLAVYPGASGKELIGKEENSPHPYVYDGIRKQWRAWKAGATWARSQAPAVGADDARDAARYRWLTEKPGFIRPHLNGQPVYVNWSGTGAQLDAAIDAAMAAADSLVPVQHTAPQQGEN